MASSYQHRKPLAGLGLLLVLSVLCGQFSATIHELKVRHAACPQHGELMDIDDAASGPTSDLSIPNQPQLSGVGFPHPSQHQHCLLVSARSEQKLFRLPAPHPEKLSVVELAVASHTEARHLSAAIYLTAPKHSPPLS
jgi:hypothetical protein